MNNVEKFHPVEVGESYRFNPDELLEAAKGQGFTNLVILAEQRDGGDPTALNKATTALDGHTEATRALTKACEQMAEHVRYLTAEMDRVREELRIQREIRRDR